MIGRGIGWCFATAREWVARGLVSLGVTPNELTVFGTLMMIPAGVCYALGAGQSFAWSLDPRGSSGAFLLLGGVLIIASSACDMLDGAVARLSNKSSPFGAILDSTLDRIGDFAVYAGIASYYAFHSPVNPTFTLLSMICFLNAFMISYVKARAENTIGNCGVGYWTRGERTAAVLVATLAYNVPAMIVQQAALPIFTLLRRILHTRAVLGGKTPVTNARQGRWRHKIQPWLYPRGSWPYDVMTAAYIAWLIWAPVDPARWDVIRWWIG
ncbi:MAG TPA: CDP-alcohol phosphatidyltransferase family protein [Phycisphaerae bacterium]|nr:CDP-alcohol phosphatidyltransferase family protein [Phycisphaerae bacterium]